MVNKMKWSKSYVEYKPRAKIKLCRNCINYVMVNTCSMVKGHIYPHGSCMFFRKE